MILDEADCRAIAEAGAARIDLDDQTVDSAKTGVLRFEIDEEIKHRLSNGLDDIGVTLKNVGGDRRLRGGGQRRPRAGHDQ